MNPVVETLMDRLIAAGLDYSKAQQLASRIERRIRKARAWKAAAAEDRATNGQRNAAGARLANIIRDMLRDEAGLNNVTVTFQPARAQVIKIQAAALRGGEVEL